MTFIEREKCRV